MPWTSLSLLPVSGRWYGCVFALVAVGFDLFPQFLKYDFGVESLLAACVS